MLRPLHKQKKGAVLERPRLVGEIAGWNKSAGFLVYGAPCAAYIGVDQMFPVSPLGGMVGRVNASCGRYRAIVHRTTG